jgi:hypothetical protein
MKELIRETLRELTPFLKRGYVPYVFSILDNFALKARGEWPGQERRPSAEDCLHRVRRLPAKEKPYRFKCEICGQRQKVLSGLDLDGLESCLRG